jgi:hypothetical protein
MAAVFQNQQNVAGAFRGGDLEVTFAGKVRGMLAQQIQFSYTQSTSMLYEVGSNDVYMVAGRASGQGSVDRIVGPNALAAQTLLNFGDVCKIKDNTIQFNAKSRPCGGAQPGQVNYKISGCLLATIGARVTAQDVMVNEQLAYTFIDLDRDGGGGGGGGAVAGAVAGAAAGLL